MELIRGLHNLRPQHRGCVATLGNFDGVHLGHQAVLAQLKQQAQKRNLPTCVLVFEPQPREFFARRQAPARLSLLRDKYQLLAQQGIDRLLCLAFNQRLRGLDARAFIQNVLLDGLGVQFLVVGDDFRFGCDRAGDFHLLQEVGQDAGFDVAHTHTFMRADERVSSTRVRTLLASGNLQQAAVMLGRPYQISGRVIYGRQLGRQWGVPTANIALRHPVLPLQGVFAVLARVDDQIWPAVANIGFRPSVDSLVPRLEVHLLDAQAHLYGQRLQVIFCARLREEQKFADLHQLQQQIYADIQSARDYFDAHKAMHVQPSASVNLWAHPPLASAPLAY
ncbi:riboflavin kinase / FMN adenylyltransferase [Allopseudospirillum japonicum]|uniref:Riboflavin biosynthesis protein n=1 Tax=Allopseudospirillum japonicum TaxID=64971 RepID=A0A1H6SGU7_9GAMM|nr:bifunctional riboflavin kinase/FAD synthetase [Allopseudospirillum japonicum]SEI67149.1 riboflavin kinase / FMN adenylyltransferase [Allopseudospirillum japonicum]